MTEEERQAAYRKLREAVDALIEGDEDEDDVIDAVEQAINDAAG